MAKPKNYKLRGKQDAFVKSYVLTSNATQAAIEAGYSEKTARFIGSENLTKPNIAEAIKDHQSKLNSEFAHSKDAKLKILQDVMDACKVKNSEKGVLNAAAVISAIKEHNLMMGHNAPTESTSTIKVEKSLAERLTNASKR